MDHKSLSAVVYLSAYVGQVRMLSVARTPLSQHRRMNLQHAVQHSLNISLVRPYANKPGETHTLPPTGLISTSSLPIRSEPRAETTCLFTLVDIRNAVIMFASTQSACAQMCFRCTDNRILISYFPEKGVYELIRCTNY